MSAAPDTREFPHTGPVDVNVRLGGGDLVVTAEPTDGVVVRVSPGDGSEASRTAAANTRVDLEGGRLRVEAPDASGGWLFRRSGQVDIVIRLPQESRLRAVTGSADIRVDGRIGSVDLNTGSGDVFVTSTSGDVTVKTGSGDVRGDLVGGEMKVNTGSGDVTFGTATGAAAVMTGSGDLDIEDARAAVTAHTASGDIRLRTVRSGDIRANTASGDVVVGVPVGTRVWLDLNTVSGSTVSHLEMSSNPPDGGAQVNLRLQTVSGDITINRVDAATAPEPSTQD